MKHEITASGTYKPPYEDNETMRDVSAELLEEFSDEHGDVRVTNLTMAWDDATEKYFYEIEGYK